MQYFSSLNYLQTIQLNFFTRLCTDFVGCSFYVHFLKTGVCQHNGDHEVESENDYFGDSQSASRLAEKAPNLIILDGPNRGSKILNLGFATDISVPPSRENCRVSVLESEKLSGRRKLFEARQRKYKFYQR